MLTMRTTPLGALALAVVGASTAHADSFSVYVQGHGGYAGANTKEVLPGGQPDLGPTLGLELGGKFLAFSGYFGLDDYLSRGTVTRFILNFGGDAGLAGWRVSGRIGAGLIFENNGALGGMAVPSDRTGVVGRAGLAFDRSLSAGLFLGVGLDAEYFALKPNDDSAVDTSVHTGADVLGSLHLRFELGI
jgi:hypothetical protein